MASVGDLERTLWLADDLVSEPSVGAVALVQCGRASLAAADLSRVLRAAGRPPINLVIADREQAQSQRTLRTLSGAAAVWVFVDDLYEAFHTLFATQLAFALRKVARDGFPVVGIGSGALALGGLMVAHRVCIRSKYDLVSGLGWAPRLLVDGGADRGIIDGAIARDAACSLPGLLGVDVGLRGGVKVQGGRVQSVGEEPIILFGGDANQHLLSMELDPGESTTIAPPPFAPFTRDLLPAHVVGALSVEQRPRPILAGPAVPPPSIAPAEPTTTGRMCPMCNKVHQHTDARLELAA